MDLSFAEINYTLKAEIPQQLGLSLPEKKSKASDNIHIRLKNIENLVSGKYTLAVGWFEGNTYPNGELVGDVARKQEFGDGNIPPRPFIRPAKRANLRKWEKIIMQGIKKEIKNGKGNFLNALNGLGLVASGDIKEAIERVLTPPLAKSTIKARMERRGIESKDGLSGEQISILEKPLIDTGRMISTVEYHASKG